MLHFSNFDDVACIACGITITNPAMVARLRNQAHHLSASEIAAHLAGAIANATDAAHALAWEEAQFGEGRPETQVDQEYFEELVAAWSIIATEHQIASLDACLLEAASIH